MAVQIVGFGGFPQGHVLQHVFELAGDDSVLVDQTASPQHPPVELPGEVTLPVRVLSP